MLAHVNYEHVLPHRRLPMSVSLISGKIKTEYGEGEPMNNHGNRHSNHVAKDGYCNKGSFAVMPFEAFFAAFLS
jgi:hypothetical protein